MESMVDSRAQQVQRWLDARGHSYRWLADKIGRNHQSVTDYVQGKTRPPPADAFRARGVSLTQSSFCLLVSWRPKTKY